MLVDETVIMVKAGKGGDGHVSFRREKYVPKGGPAGGDGGKGGSVILVASHGVDTLLDLAGHHHWNADNGGDGSIKQKAGRDAEDLVIRVPPGTVIFDDTTKEVIADLDTVGKSIVVAKGGKGGWGNEHFKSSTNQTPRHATPGEPGEERTLRLELKLIADIGLVGKPNAGKSTLLSRISKATPKIADYPFTTLTPQLGIAEISGRGGALPRRMVIADIPGLIEGAHHGAGLGTQFLRHIERTRVLVHLVEIEPSDGSNPIDNFQIICRELASYSPTLAAKPMIVALTKMDLLMTPEDQLTAVQLIQQGINREVYPISSASGEGMIELLELCWRMLDKSAPSAIDPTPTPSPNSKV